MTHNEGLMYVKNLALAHVFGRRQDETLGEGAAWVNARASVAWENAQRAYWEGLWAAGWQGPWPAYV